jgi:hemerythrin-like metal-binding protein
MPIQWTTDMALGSPELDGQHLQLDANLRLLHDALVEGRAPDLAQVLGGVRAFATGHFPAEERLLREAGAEELPRHRAEHVRFGEELARFEALHRARGDALPLAMELGNFLTAWIHEHQRHDAALRRLLAQRGPATLGGG